jgi:hypothetical protein
VLPLHRKVRLGRSLLSDFLSRWIPLIPHTPSFGHLKKRLWWNRWSDISRCRKDIRTHFLHPVHKKKETLTKSLKYCFNRQMDLTPQKPMRTYCFMSSKKRTFL